MPDGSHAGCSISSSKVSHTAILFVHQGSHGSTWCLLIPVGLACQPSSARTFLHVLLHGILAADVEHSDISSCKMLISCCLYHANKVIWLTSGRWSIYAKVLSADMMCFDIRVAGRRTTSSTGTGSVYESNPEPDHGNPSLEKCGTAEYSGLTMPLSRNKV